MLKTIIVLPGGTEISSGVNQQNAIKTVKITECVNSGEDLILGSTCSNALEVTLITPEGGLSLAAGTEVTVYKDDGASRKKVGVFILEKPTRPSANTMKVTGYDRVSKLDKDLSAWLAGLDRWPYALTTFAGMVCTACGLTYKPSTVVNGDFQVQQFTRSAVTGRQIMQWLGEICARFCRATPDGEIEFAWYTDSGKTVTVGGDIYYFQNSLSYDDFITEKVDAVQLRLANSDNGALWPENTNAVNSYIITGNAILNLQITETLRPVLANIQAAIANVAYTPCKVSIPANMAIHAGNTVKIIDKNGREITTYVMTKTQSGQKDELECTGNHKRNSTSAANNKTAGERYAEANAYADAAAGNAAHSAVDNQSHEDIFKKLTNNGEIQGLYTKDGVWYVNCEFAKIINLVADAIVAGVLKSKDGTTHFDLDAGIIACYGAGRTLDIYAGELSVYDDWGRTLIWVGDVGKALDPNNKFGVHLFGRDSLSNEKYIGGLLTGDELTMRALNLDEQARVLEDHKVGWKTIAGQRCLVAFD